MSKYAILGFDPGLLCGWTEVTVPSKAPAVVTHRAEVPGTQAALLKEWNAWHTRCHDNGIKRRHRIVVAEDWTWRPGQEFDPHARDACVPLGGVLMLAEAGQVPVHLQIPGARVGVPDTKEEWDRINLADLYYLPGGKGHWRQALRHVLRYLQSTAMHRATMELLHPR